jgi:hypothetical protein
MVETREWMKKQSQGLGQILLIPALLAVRLVKDKKKCQKQYSLHKHGFMVNPRAHPCHFL